VGKRFRKDLTRMSCGLLGFYLGRKKETTMPNSKESKTHFEQVPLEIVKEIAEEDIPDDEANADEEIVEASPKKLGRIPRSRVNHGKRP
jgi:hypothetical protein